LVSFLSQACAHPEQSYKEDLRKAGESELGEYMLETAVRYVGTAVGEEMVWTSGMFLGEGLAGPVGWVFLGISLVDGLTYNHERNERWMDDADQHVIRSNQEFDDGEYIEAIKYSAIAFGEDAVAGLSEAGHEIARAPEELGHLAYQAGSWLYRHVSSAAYSLSSSMSSLFSSHSHHAERSASRHSR
jgi:hypothetical protein